MFKHDTGWELNAQILRHVTDHMEIMEPANAAYLSQVVREEIAQDRELVWC